MPRIASLLQNEMPDSLQRLTDRFWPLHNRHVSNPSLW